MTVRVDARTAQRRHVVRLLLLGLHQPKTINSTHLARETGLTSKTVWNFLRDRHEICHETLETLEWYVWRKLHAHELLSPEDFQ